jgi:antitoxin HicB
MTFNYPAKITLSEKDNVYEVTFPDLPGCITYGETFEEARQQAAEALTGYLESVLSREIEFQGPSAISGDVYEIEPEKHVAFALWLRRKRKEAGMTQSDAAAKLGVKYQVYQRLEDPRRSNPTLKTIEKLERVFGSRILAV